MKKKIIISGLAGVAILVVGIFAYVNLPDSVPPFLPAIQTEQHDARQILQQTSSPMPQPTIKSAETPSTLKIVTATQTVPTKPNAQQATGYWAQDQYGWRAVGTPPQCPEPLELSSFVDVNKATSKLYPGQMRSVGYESTAGFRFDGLPNEAVTITVPLSGEVVQAARSLVEGEIQYVFDMISPCGIMFRFDHLLAVTPKFQTIANKLPEPKANDTRSTSVYPPVKVVMGEMIATAVGIHKNKNTFVSFTMYDFRRKNSISQDPAWAAEHPQLDHYVICPFPYFPEEERERVNSLPAADWMSGSKSDFCN